MSSSSQVPDLVSQFESQQSKPASGAPDLVGQFEAAQAQPGSDYTSGAPSPPEFTANDITNAQRADAGLPPNEPLRPVPDTPMRRKSANPYAAYIPQTPTPEEQVAGGQPLSKTIHSAWDSVARTFKPITDFTGLTEETPRQVDPGKGGWRDTSSVRHPDAATNARVASGDNLMPTGKYSVDKPSDAQLHGKTAYQGAYSDIGRAIHPYWLQYAFRGAKLPGMSQPYAYTGPKQYGEGGEGQQFLHPEELADTQNSPTTHGLLEAVGKFMTPGNMALMAVPFGGAPGAIGKVAGTSVSAYFAAQMAQGLYQKNKEFHDGVDRVNQLSAILAHAPESQRKELQIRIDDQINQMKQLAGAALFEGPMAALTAKHAAAGVTGTQTSYDVSPGPRPTRTGTISAFDGRFGAGFQSTPESVSVGVKVGDVGIGRKFPRKFSYDSQPAEAPSSRQTQGLLNAQPAANEITGTPHTPISPQAAKDADFFLNGPKPQPANGPKVSSPPLTDAEAALLRHAQSRGDIPASAPAPTPPPPGPEHITPSSLDGISQAIASAPPDAQPAMKLKVYQNLVGWIMSRPGRSFADPVTGEIHTAKDVDDAAKIAREVIKRAGEAHDKAQADRAEQAAAATAQPLPAVQHPALHPDQIDQITQQIASRPPAEHPQAILDAHQQLTQAITEAGGRYVTTNAQGHLQKYTVDHTDPGAVEKAADEIVNSAEKRYQTGLAEQQKATEAAAKAAPKGSLTTDPVTSKLRDNAVPDGWKIELLKEPGHRYPTHEVYDASGRLMARSAMRSEALRQAADVYETQGSGDVTPAPSTPTTTVNPAPIVAQQSEVRANQAAPTTGAQGGNRTEIVGSPATTPVSALGRRARQLVAVGDTRPGEQLYSASGRQMSRIPNRAGYDSWLVGEAKQESPKVSGWLEKINPKNPNLTDATRDALNQIVFGNPDGPTAAHRTPQPKVQVAKPAASTPAPGPQAPDISHVGPHPMGSDMTQDSPAVRAVHENSDLVEGQQPTVMVKDESATNRAKLEQPAKPADPEALAGVGETDKESGRKIVQPSDSPIHLERLAQEAAPELASTLSHIAAHVPGAKFDRLRPFKNFNRVGQKVEADGKPPETVADYLAAQVAMDTPQAKEQFLSALEATGNVLNVEDNFLSGNPKMVNYPSTNVQLQLSNGVSAEIQIVPREMQEITDVSHSHYTDGRKAELRGDSKAAAEAYDRAATINADALRRFKERNGVGEARESDLDQAAKSLAVDEERPWRDLLQKQFGALDKVEQGMAFNPSIRNASAEHLRFIVGSIQKHRSNSGSVVPERRQNAAQRKRVSEMSPEERSGALLTSDKTGLPNLRAFQEDSATLGESHPHVGYADLDDFKKMNTALGHEGVDTAVLPAIGEIFRNAINKEPGGSVKVYHRSGDEFLFRADDPARVKRVVERVNKELANTTFQYETPDGKILEKKGAGLSHGIGESPDSAEAAADLDKQSRKAAGLRTGTRDVPAVAEGRAAGEQVGQRETAGRAGISGKEEVEPVHKFASTQINIDPQSDLGKFHAAAVAAIPEEHIGKEGREKTPHITVRYGLQDDSPAGVEKIKAAVAKIPAFEVPVGKTDIFPASEHSSGDNPVIAKLEKTPELLKLRDTVEGAGGFKEDNFPSYEPHITMAYIKPEFADEYKGGTQLEGQKVPIKEITVSKRDGTTEMLPLGKATDKISEKSHPATAKPTNPYHAKAEASLAAAKKPGATAGDRMRAYGDEKAYRKMAEQFDRGEIDERGKSTAPPPPPSGISGTIRDGDSLTHQDGRTGKVVGTYIKGAKSVKVNFEGAKEPEVVPARFIAQEQSAPKAEAPAAAPKATHEMTLAEFREAVRSGKSDYKGLGSVKASGSQRAQELANAEKSGRNVEQARSVFNASTELAHGAAVTMAVARGAKVPPEVIKDYPALVGKGPGREPVSTVDPRTLSDEQLAAVKDAKPEPRFAIKKADIVPTEEGGYEARPQTETPTPKPRKITAADLPEGWKVSQDKNGWKVTAGEHNITTHARSYEDAVRDAYNKKDEINLPETQPASYKVAVKGKGDPDWTYNSLRYPSKELAEDAGHDLAGRWGGVDKWEVHPSDEAPNKGIEKTEEPKAPAKYEPKVGDLVTYQGKEQEVGFITPGGVMKLQDPATKERTHNFVTADSVTPVEKKAQAGVPALIDDIYRKLRNGESLGNVTALNALAEKHLGADRTSGEYTPKDIFDAMEAGVNRYLVDAGDDLMGMDAIDGLDHLRDLMDRLPSQGVRTEDQIKNQQFSTPPTESYVAAKLADLKKSDTVLEPSAGNGGLAVWPKSIGAKVHVNEIAPRRQEMLKAAGFGQATAHDGEIINSLLDKSVQPTVILMNPPFSASTMKSFEAANSNTYGFNHVDSALQRLAPGGRLVAILGGGRADDTNGGASLSTGPSGKWFERLGDRYNVRANVRIHGREYQKYGTAFATRLIVIDKDGPTPSRVTPGQVKTWDSVKQGNFNTLEEAYNALRDVADSRPKNEAGIAGNAGAGQGKPGTRLAADTQPGGAGGRNPGRGQYETGAGIRTAGGSGGPAGESGGDRPGAGNQPVSLRQPEVRPETAGNESSAAGRPEGGPANGNEERPLPDVTDKNGISLERERPETRAEQQDTSSYVAYHPSIKGAAHPANIVETKTMATVPMPELTYKPSFPKEMLDSGKISAVQLEAISIAGQQNNITLPSGARATALIGDGTGVGKGRISAGILLDNWNKGRRRMVWVSQNWGLMEDAKRDLAGIGADHLLKGVAALRKLAPTATHKIEHEGIVFTTYALMRSADKQGNTRASQLQQWLNGKDGGDSAYILYDESHNLKNAVVGNGSQASQIGMTVNKLMDEMPKLRSAYLSATPVSEVGNLGYLNRLGIWGPGTPFPNGFNEFASAIGSGGMSAMELVARELKAQGKYLSRTLSYKGVTYEEVEHKLNDDQKEVYRTASKAWKMVGKQAQATIEHTTNGGSQAKGRFLSQFYGAQQRFFNVLLTTLKIPTALEKANQALADGKSVVVTLVNTNEAAQNREKARFNDAENPEEIPEYDFGPGEMLQQLVRDNYPVQQWRDDVDSAGNPIKTQVFEKDKDGRDIPVLNPQAIAERDKLLADLKQMVRMPANPLDILVDSLGGEKKVAEVTGRKERYDDSKGKFVPRGDPNVARDKINKVEEENFNSGKKRVVILSSAGGTGLSFHAGNEFKNKQPRYHITLQVGWSADRAMQMLGRTHRSNQAQPPEYALLKSDMGGENRFVSTLARRMGSLEALGKGQTKTNEGTEMMDKVNFETDQGIQATDAFYGAMLKNQPIPGTEDADGQALSGHQVLSELGVLKPDGTVSQSDRRNVTRLLNRLLALDPDVQNAAYDYFYDIFDATVKSAIEDGTLDTGVKTLPGDEFNVKEHRLLAKDPSTGAETYYYPVDSSVRTNRVSRKQVEREIKQKKAAEPKLYYSPDENKMILAVKAKAIVRADGHTEEAVHTMSPDNGNWTKIPESKLTGWSSRYRPVEDWIKKQAADAATAEASAAREVERAKGYVDSYKDDWSQKNLEEKQQALEVAQKAAAEAQARDPKTWPLDQWEEIYGQAPSHNTVEHHLIGGAVLKYWNPIKDAAGTGNNIFTTTDSKTGRRIVGIDVPQAQIRQLLDRITGNQSTVNAHQLHDDVMRNDQRYTLEGGIQVRRGRVAGKSVVQFIPPGEDVARTLRGMGVVYEKGVQPIHYLPTGDMRENVLDKVLKQYPVKPDEGPAPEPDSPSFSEHNSADWKIKEGQHTYVVRDAQGNKMGEVGKGTVSSTEEAKAYIERNVRESAAQDKNRISVNYQPPTDSNPPVLTISTGAQRLISKVTVNPQFSGVRMQHDIVTATADRLEQEAKLYTRIGASDMGQDAQNLADSFRQAAKDAGPQGVIAIREGAPASTYEEERFHSGQGEMGEGNVVEHLTTERAEKLLAQHPVTNYFQKVFGESPHYSKLGPIMKTAEIAAKIASGQHGPLSAKDRADWFNRYVDELEDQHGPEKVAEVFGKMYDSAKELYGQAKDTDARAAAGAVSGRPGEGEGGIRPASEGPPEHEAQSSAQSPGTVGAGENGRGEAQESPVNLSAGDVRKQTDTPEFRRWFGGSTVVDEQGQPLVMYHGTDANFDTFKISSYGELGAHFGTMEQAQAMGVGHRQPGNLLPVYLRIENPLRLEDMGKFSSEELLPQLEKLGVVKPGEIKLRNQSLALAEISKAIKRSGYDGIVYLNRGEGAEPFGEKFQELLHKYLERAGEVDRALKMRGVSSEDAGLAVDNPDEHKSLLGDLYNKAIEAKEAKESSEKYNEKFGRAGEMSDEEFRREFPKARDSYIVLDPTQVKSASGNRGTFDPKNPDINFSAEPGEKPWSLSRLIKNLILPKESAESISSSQPIVRVSDDDATWLSKTTQLAHLAKDGGVVRGSSLSAAQIERMANEIGDMGQRVLSAKLMDAARQAGVRGVILVHEGSPRHVEEEELFHGAQRELGKGGISHLPRSAMDRLLSHPVAQFIMSDLGSNGYNAGKPEIAIAEIAAKIATGSDFSEIDEAADWLDKYFRELHDYHGPDRTGQVFDSLPSRAKEFYREARRKQESELTANRQGGGRGTGEAEQGVGRFPAGQTQTDTKAGDSADKKIQRQGVKGLQKSLGPKVPAGREGEAGFAKANLPGTVLGAVRDFLTEQKPETKVARGIDDKLFELGKQQEADALRMLQFMKEAAPHTTPEDQAQIFRSYEPRTNVNLTPEQQAFRNDIQPIKDASSRIRAELNKIGIPMGEEGFVHREVKGKAGVLDRAAAGKPGSGKGNILSTSASSLKQREMFALVDPAGKATVIKKADGRITAFVNGKASDLGPSSNIATAGERLERASRSAEEDIKAAQERIGEIPEEDRKAQLDNLNAQIKNLSRQQSLLGTVKGRVIGGESVHGVEPTFTQRKNITTELDKLTRRRDEIAAIKGPFNVTTAEDPALGFMSSRGQAEFKRETDNLRAAQLRLAAAKDTYGKYNPKDKIFRGKNGKDWHFTEANSDEIQNNTNIEYHQNALASVVSDYLQLRRAQRAVHALEEMKNSPELWQGDKPTFFRSENGSMPPDLDNYKRIDANLPIFRDIWAEKRTAEALNRFAQELHQDPQSAIDKIGHFMTATLMLNPIRHIYNIGNHWLVERGLVAGTWHALTSTADYRAGIRAIRAVTTLNEDFKAALDEGAPMMSHRADLRDMNRTIYNMMMGHLEENPEVAGQIARFIGWDKADAADSGIGNLTSRSLGLRFLNNMRKAGNRAMWMSNDIFILQSAYAKMERGAVRQADGSLVYPPGAPTFKEALAETVKHIPDYRIPPRVLDSLALSKVMASPLATVFSRYHYGQWKSYGHMLNEVAAKDSTPKERLKGLDHMAAIAFVTFGLYLAVDQILKKVSGDKDARMVRSGASALPYNVSELAKGHKAPEELIQSTFTPAMFPKFIAELATNTDIYSRSKIYDRHDTAGHIAQDIGGHFAASLGPIQQAEQASRQEHPTRNFFFNQVGVTFPKSESQSDSVRLLHEYMRENSTISPDAKRHMDEVRAAFPEGTPGKQVADAKKAAVGELRYYLEADRRFHMIEREQLRRIYAAATPEEKKIIGPYLVQKAAKDMRNRSATPADRDKDRKIIEDTRMELSRP